MEEGRPKNDSIGTSYTFRDKHNKNGKPTNHSLVSKTDRSERDFSGELESKFTEEQPSMITNSELKSIDLNVLGEWYVPSSDNFSEHKDEDIEEQKEIEFKEQDKTLDTSKKGRNLQRKFDSMDSQKIDELLKKSIDCFIYETKDIVTQSKNSNNFQSREDDNNRTNQSDLNKQNLIPTVLNNQGAFQRSASQKWNYSKTPVNEKNQRIYQASPIDSGSKRSTDRRQSKPYSIPHTNQNFVIPPRYSSLVPNQYINNEVYYAQNRDQIRQANNHSFNIPRKVDKMPETYQYQVSNSLNYPALHHTSLDENIMPSTFARQTIPSSQHPQTSTSAAELQYSVEDLDNYPQSHRNLIGYEASETQLQSEKSPQAVKTMSVTKPSKSSDNSLAALVQPAPKHLRSSNSLHLPSESSQLTLLCLNLYEILNKNKIVSKYNSSNEPPAEMITKMFVSTSP